jgi:hypothetical protein
MTLVLHYPLTLQFFCWTILLLESLLVGWSLCCTTLCRVIINTGASERLRLQDTYMYADALGIPHEEHRPRGSRSLT